MKKTKKTPTKRVVKEKETYLFDGGKVKLGVPSGSLVEGYIDGKKVKGRIFNPKDGTGNMFFCQNKFDGFESPNKLGYKFSYEFDSDNPKGEGVEIKKITLDPKFKLPPTDIFINGNRPIYHKGHIEIGCTCIPNSVVRRICKSLKD